MQPNAIKKLRDAATHDVSWPMLRNAYPVHKRRVHSIRLLVRGDGYRAEECDKLRGEMWLREEIIS